MVSDLKSILGDNQSGSAGILNKCINYILDITDNEDDLINKIQHALDGVQRTFPDFALIHHFSRYLNARIHGQLSRKEVSRVIQSYVTEWQNVNQAIAGNVLNTTPLSHASVLLHSNSSTLQALFSAASSAGIQMHVYQTVSAPNGEGIPQAKILAGMHYEVTLLTEAAVSLIMKDLNMVLFGADRIHPGHFINKTGSLPLALMAQKFNVPVYVLADSRKIWQESYGDVAHEETPKPESEILPESTPYLKVMNYYFEAIPNALVSRFMFEKDIRAFG